MLELSKPFLGPNKVDMDDVSKFQSLMKTDQIVTVDEVSEHLTANTKNMQTGEDMEELNATGTLTN